MKPGAKSCLYISNLDECSSGNAVPQSIRLESEVEHPGEQTSIDPSEFITPFIAQQNLTCSDFILCV